MSLSNATPPPTWDDFLSSLEAARAGDEEALRVLFDHFYPTVQRMVHRSLAQDPRFRRPWVESVFSTGDVVQDVFMNVLRSLDAVESTNEAAFRGYLAMLVRNRLIDSIRFHEAARRDRRRHQRCEEEYEPASPARGPSTQVSSAEELGLFRAALARFPSRERLLLRERIERGETFAVLAEHLGYPSADAARKAFYAAQARLLVLLQKDGMSLPESR